MKKLALFLAATVIAITLSGCGLDETRYPYVRVQYGIYSGNCMEIGIGNKYIYTGFDTADIDGGKDLVLHFAGVEE